MNISVESTRGPNRPRRFSVLLDGPYGRANLGDNAIAYCIAEFLTQNGIDVTISCRDPDYIAETFRLNTIRMLDFRRAAYEPFRRMSEFDAVVIGGGQQFKEYKFPNPFVGMFARVCQMARAAKKRDMPFIAWAVGMDWPLSYIAKSMGRRYFNYSKATLIFRDERSFAHAQEFLGDVSCKIMQSKDVVFMIPELLQTAKTTGIEEKYGPSTSKRLLICPSDVHAADGLIDRIVELGRQAAENGYEVLGWHSEIRFDYDVRVRAVAGWNTIPGFRWLPNDAINTNEVAALIGTSSLVLTTRMHPAIIAVSQRVAAYGFATNAKMRSVFDELGMPYSNPDDDALSFTDIASLSYEPCFAMAETFSRRVIEDGQRVLAAIRGERP